VGEREIYRQDETEAEDDDSGRTLWAGIAAELNRAQQPDSGATPAQRYDAQGALDSYQQAIAAAEQAQPQMEQPPAWGSPTEAGIASGTIQGSDLGWAPSSTQERNSDYQSGPEQPAPYSNQEQGVVNLPDGSMLVRDPEDNGQVVEYSVDPNGQQTTSYYFKDGSSVVDTPQGETWSYDSQGSLNVVQGPTWSREETYISPEDLK
jgi:hypothetical protein